MKLIDTDTLKSKTFWSILALGVFHIIKGQGVIDDSVTPIVEIVLNTLFGAAAVDRTTKMIKAGG